jgi:hypothetical protein
MRVSSWVFRVIWLVGSGLAAGCAEPTAQVQEAMVGPPPPPQATSDSCTPASGGYLSCEQALSATGAHAGCFMILPGALASPPFARQCAFDRVLVVQVFDGAAQPATDQGYLDTVLDSLTSFVDAASYGRDVLGIEVAGDPQLATAARWFPAAATRSDVLAEIQPSQALHALDYYDRFVILSTEDGRSVETSCTVTVNGTALQRPCATTYHYRASSDPTATSTSVHHEFGHALGLQHDHSLSSAAGYGAVRTTFEGELVQYGGRSSVMGTNTDAPYNLPERVKLGWLNDGNTTGGGRHVHAVEATGARVDDTVAFDTLAQDVEAIKGVIVPSTDGNYWIEARRDAVMDPALTTGVILHFSSDKVRDSQMIDGTPETPSDALVDGALPIGRTFADPTRGIYITALSETSSSATIEVQRDPVDPNPPVITAVTAINCTTSPASCPGLVSVPGFDWWRYAATASDADGDPLSYSWRFGIGTSGVTTGSVYRAGAVVFRLLARPAAPARAFVTVSDRKGGEATSFVNQGGYRGAWVGPSLAAVGLSIVSLDPRDARSDNELRFETTGAPTGTELLDHAWTINGTTTTAWPTPVIDPQVFALADATAPSCIPATLRVTDATNCSAEPVACTTSTTACVPVPLRLSWLAVPGPFGLPRSFNLTLSADMLALYPNGATPTIAWDAACPVTVAASGLTATMPAPGCKITVTLHTSNRTYAVSAVPN